MEKMLKMLCLVLEKLCREFGEHPEILYHFTTLNLYKRQPGLAKRSALLQQISASIRPTSINLGNQLATYEMNGQADWMRFLSPSCCRLSPFWLSLSCRQI